MSDFNAIGATARIYRKWGTLKLGLTAAALAIAAALLGGVQHSQAYADSPTPTSAHASHSTDDASQALRRYTLQLLHILSDADANKWQRYRQAMPHCAAAPAYLDEINANNDVSPLDATLIALTEDLCADLDQRLDDAKTVGLLVNEPEAMPGYALIPGGFNNYTHLIDHLGRVVHSWQSEKRTSHGKLLDNGNLLQYSVGPNPENPDIPDRSISEVAPDGNVVWQYTHTDRIHHDFLKMPNGNVLILMAGVKTREEAIAAGRNPDIVPSGGVDYDYIIEVRPTGSEGGEIVWEWSTWDYLVQDFDASKDNYGDTSEYPELIDINFLAETPISPLSGNLDWLHANAIDYNPELDQIVMSPRQYNELWVINYSAFAEEARTRSGRNSSKDDALLYRWGNPSAYGHGTAADQRLFRQHHTQWIDPGLPGAGNILVFNNGWGFGEDQRRFYSSIDEIVPPVDGYGYRREPGAPYSPAEPVWTYTAETPTDFFSRIGGGVQRLPNGNTLISETTSGNLFQVTPEGKTVWQYVYPMDGDTPLNQGEQPSPFNPAGVFNNAFYRAYWYAPDYPGLQKYALTPGDTIELYE